MQKNIIITVGFVVLVIAGILFFTKNSKESLTREASEGGVADTLSINNIDNTKTVEKTTENTKQMTKEITSATLRTSKGDITFEFFKSDAPKTVANFIKLVEAGFYNKTKFHRVIKGFMIQGGDPFTKDDAKINLWGTGDPGYKFADEIDPKSDLYAKVGYKKGIVAMANSGANTNGSQFFIMTENYPLPSLYTIFGKVTSGQDVVDKIANVPTSAGDRPVTAVVIESISLK